MIAVGLCALCGAPLDATGSRTCSCRRGYDATARRRWYRMVLRGLRDGLALRAALTAADYAVSVGELLVGRGGVA